MNNIQPVSDALLCSNCGACKAICPKNAISFSFSSIGRMYAVVNESCIECKACVKVCPSIDYHGLHRTFSDKYVGNIVQTYVGRATDRKIFAESQSGGACTATLIYLFKHDLIDAAVVCRMVPQKSPIVEAYIAESVEQLCESQKSKYTPVELLSALRQTNSKKSVAIVGLPCHLQGVESLSRQSKKRFQNISYKLGLICDRTLGATLQNVMLTYSEKKEPAIIEWRKKDFSYDGTYYPYHSAPIRIKYAKDKSLVLPNTYRFALKDMYTPPRCRVCYDKLNTFADIVFGDPWGMSNVDLKRGDSLVITRSLRGESLIQNMIKSGDVFLKISEVNELLEGQHIQERRRTVSSYSVAIQSLPIKIDSYLYNQKDVSKNRQIDILRSLKNLNEYVCNEQLSVEEVLNESRKVVKWNECQLRIKRFFIIRALNKLIRLIKSFNKK